MTTPDPCCDSEEFWRQRLAAKQAQLIAVDAAILQVATTGQSYQLNTGQTQQLVSKGNVGSFRLLAKTLEQDIAAIQQRLNGCGAFNMRPGW